MNKICKDCVVAYIEAKKIFLTSLDAGIDRYTFIKVIEELKQTPNGNDIHRDFMNLMDLYYYTPERKILTVKECLDMYEKEHPGL